MNAAQSSFSCRDHTVEMCNEGNHGIVPLVSSVVSMYSVFEIMFLV